MKEHLLGKTWKMWAKCLSGGRKGWAGIKEIWEGSQANQNE